MLNVLISLGLKGVLQILARLLIFTLTLDIINIELILIDAYLLHKLNTG